MTDNKSEKNIVTPSNVSLKPSSSDNFYKPPLPKN